MQSSMQKIRKSLISDLRDTGLLRSKGLIQGEWLPAASGELFKVLDPATDIEVEHVSAMGAEDTERAVDAAVQSFAGWKGKTAQVRY